ncbi:MAG TPA: GntR family transcriptional regulator [Thermoanaerobaculia bacterium]|jgi:GntR family transcriptional regulator|nr:GntR family transcriptional regulator [Thermoanaerobaculia bacterium]
MPFPISIDTRDPTPLYAQLERGVRIAIATGRLKPGDQLPTVRQLAVELRVNANTVAKVYLALEREGVVVTKRGVGTFIAEAQVARANEKHRERQLGTIADRYLTEATSLGFTPREVVRFLAQRIKEGE